MWTFPCSYAGQGSFGFQPASRSISGSITLKNGNDSDESPDVGLVKSDHETEQTDTLDRPHVRTADTQASSQKLHDIIRRYYCQTADRYGAGLSASSPVQTGVWTVYYYGVIECSMHVVIGGGGRVGSQTATHLAADGHSTTIIESHEPTANEVPESDLIEVVLGDAVSPETFREVSIDRTDVFAALTGDTNANVAACYIARTRSPSIKTVMRIGSDDEREYGDHEAIDAVIFPEAVGAESATKQILQP